MAPAPKLALLLCLAGSFARQMTLMPDSTANHGIQASTKFAHSCWSFSLDLVIT